MVIPEYFTIRVHRVTTPFSGRPHTDVAIANFGHFARLLIWYHCWYWVRAVL